MRLNNRGWGTKEMILMICLLLILLAVSWYYIQVLYNGKAIKNQRSAKTKYYDLVKDKLRTSAIKYYDDHNMNGKAIISYSTLKEGGYISVIRDFLELSCNGYVVVTDNDFSPFISCNNYTSEGYIKDFE